MDINKSNISIYFTDIRFWILILFVVRLYGIWFPALEVEHNWRQSTVTMAARNFLEIDSNILYPRVDIAGQLTGITGMEFPLYNYLIFLVAKIFGYQHWYGRLINLFVSSFGVFYFFKILKICFDKDKAFLGSFLLLISLWFNFSRKIMPDTFSASLAIISIYYGIAYFKDKRVVKLILYILFGALGVLSKLPVVFLFVYFVFPMLEGRLVQRHKVYFLIASTLLLLPGLYWYFKWTDYLNAKFGFWHFFMGSFYIEGMIQILSEPLKVLKRLFVTPMGISGSLLFLFSFVYGLVNKKWTSIILFTFGFCSFVGLIVFKAGWPFYHHNYYILVYIPVFVIPGAFFLSELPSKWVVSILLIVLIEGLILQFPRFEVKENHIGLIKLEEDLDKINARQDLIIINSGEYPTPMYFAHRKGWVMSNADLVKSYKVDSLTALGAKNIVVLKRTFGEDVDLPYVKLFDNVDYSIYSIDEK